MGTLSGLAGAIKVPGSSSPYVYATLVDYDPNTTLSTVEILGEQVSGIPKLREVSLEGGWETLTQGESDGPTADVTVPNSGAGIIGYRLFLAGRQTGSTGSLFMQVNEDTSSIYRRGLLVLKNDDDGSIVVSQQSNSSATSWRVGWWTGIVSHTLIELNLASDPEQWHMQANGVGQEIYRAFGYGRINTEDYGDISSIRVGSIPDTLNQLSWRLEGIRATAPAGIQLLCVRSNPVPLTIVGVLSGSTILGNESS